jgi:hypothetical protein
MLTLFLVAAGLGLVVSLLRPVPEDGAVNA